MQKSLRMLCLWKQFRRCSEGLAVAEEKGVGSGGAFPEMAPRAQRFVKLPRSPRACEA